MCNPACISFAKSELGAEEITNRSVIEVGSLDLNGSVRPFIEELKPQKYIGVDIQAGPGVDYICEASQLCDRFGTQSFDLLISTEMLEHVRDWQGVIKNFKHVLNPGGLILLTTRSYGFPYHGFPYDFWRFEVSDLNQIFADFIVENLENDPLEPGVFLKARKPLTFSEIDLTKYPLYSIIKNERVLRVSEFDVCLFRVCYQLRNLRAVGTRFYRLALRLLRMIPGIRWPHCL